MKTSRRHKVVKKLRDLLFYVEETGGGVGPDRTGPNRGAIRSAQCRAPLHPPAPPPKTV